MLTGSMKSFTPLDSNTWSPTPPLSSIISPYWNPEQPPPCTNTRSPLPTLPSSVSNSLIFDAAVAETFTIFSILQGKRPLKIIRSTAGTYKLNTNGRELFGRFLLDFPVQAVAVRVHCHNRREILHVQVPHRFRGPEFHQCDAFDPR